MREHFADRAKAFEGALMLYRVADGRRCRNATSGSTHNMYALTRIIAWRQRTPANPGRRIQPQPPDKETAVMIVELGTATRVTQGSRNVIADVGKPGHQLQ